MKSQDDIIEERIITFFIFTMQVYSKICEELVIFTPTHQGEVEQLKGFLSKILVHSGSAYQLYEGTYLPNPFFSVHTIDASSIMVLARATLEAYVSFFYTFIDTPTDDDLIFKLQYFQYRGLISRSPLTGTTETAKEQMRRVVSPPDLLFDLEQMYPSQLATILKPVTFHFASRLASLPGTVSLIVGTGL